MGTLPGLTSVRIGHAHHASARTGCTVIVCETGAVAGVDVRGGAPATRELNLLRPGNLVDRVQAVLLTGGSAFDLAAADGVMGWLHERGAGFATPAATVPIVPALALFDLRAGALVWPDAALGRQACDNALGPDLAWGAVGAGTGATVGKLLGVEHASPGGIGTHTIGLPDRTQVTAIVAVNAFGHVRDPRSHALIAGPRRADGTFVDTVEALLSAAPTAGFEAAPGQNTTIGCIITTAALDKTGCTRVAAVAHDGLARAVYPAHTQHDGDALIVMSTGDQPEAQRDLTLLGVAAAEAVALAIAHAVSA